MNAQDRQYLDRLLRFMQYDDRKDMYAVPKKRLEDYRALIERTFPQAIPI